MLEIIKKKRDMTTVPFFFMNIKAAVILHVIIKSFSKGHGNLQPSPVSLPAI